MICSYYQELISRMLDEDLSPVEQNVLLAHLPNCEACSAMYKSFSALSEALEDQLEEPPERLHDNVMAEIRRAEIRKANRLSRPVKILLSAAACAALVLGITAGGGLLRPKGALAPATPSVVLAGSNFAARSMPAEASEADTPYAAAEAESVAESAEESVAEPEAKAAIDAAEAPAAASAMMDRAAGAVQATAFDLSDRLDLEDLMDFLGRVPVDAGVEDTANALYELIVSEGGGHAVVTLYDLGGQLLYSLPDGTAYLADCSREALEGFLSR